jgi:hypothetical protein
METNEVRLASSASTMTIFSRMLSISKEYTAFADFSRNLVRVSSGTLCRAEPGIPDLDFVLANHKRMRPLTIP